VIGRAVLSILAVAASLALVALVLRYLDRQDESEPATPVETPVSRPPIAPRCIGRAPVPMVGDRITDRELVEFRTDHLIWRWLGGAGDTHPRLPYWMEHHS
jgi:hypothetical protein